MVIRANEMMPVVTMPHGKGEGDALLFSVVMSGLRCVGASREPPR